MAVVLVLHTGTSDHAVESRGIREDVADQGCHNIIVGLERKEASRSEEVCMMSHWMDGNTETEEPSQFERALWCFASLICEKR